MRFRTILIYSLLLLFCRIPAASAQKRIYATVNPNAAAVNGTAEIYNPLTGRFSPVAGQMNVAREQHAAVKLNNGKVFIAGGYNNRYLKSAELFDPATGSFTKIEEEMLTPRAGAVSALLPGGSVLLAGGYNGAYLGTAEIYDPVEETFSATYTAMSSGRTKAAAAALNSGNVLIVGGYTVAEAARGFLKTADLYDPVTREFTASAGGMDEARELHTATLLQDGKVLITGGCKNQETNEIICNKFLASAEIYDPSTDKFSVTGSMKSPRMNHTATLLRDGRVLVAGGSEGAAPLNTAEVYDPATGKFSEVGNLNITREQHTASALPDGTVLIAGGSSDHYLNSAEIFDPKTGLFTLVSSQMSVPRFRHSATALDSGGILVAGGRNKELLTFDVNFESTTDNISPNIVFSPDSSTGFVPYAGSGTVLAFSTRTGAETDRISTGGKPASITPLPNMGALAVVSALDNKIFILDVSDHLSLRNTYTFPSPVTFGFGSILTLSPDGNTGYISSSGTGEVIKFYV